jgi:hypothetical protein
MPIVVFVLAFFTVYFLLYGLILFYGGRFFYYDLILSFNHGFFKSGKDFGFFYPLTPAILRKISLPNSQTKLESLINEARPDNHQKLELILFENQILNGNHYKEIWEGLSGEEKMVLYDFSGDHFSNFKNKQVLIQLIHKGFITSDPITGRLKVMDLNFRVFVMDIKNIDADFAKKFEASSGAGTFAKWRTPAIIIAISALLLLMYLNPDSFNSILVIGSGFATTLGFLGRIFETMQKFRQV